MTEQVCVKAYATQPVRALSARRWTGLLVLLELHQPVLPQTPVKSLCCNTLTQDSGGALMPHHHVYASKTYTHTHGLVTACFVFSHTTHTALAQCRLTPLNRTLQACWNDSTTPQTGCNTGDYAHKHNQSHNDNPRGHPPKNNCRQDWHECKRAHH